MLGIIEQHRQEIIGLCRQYRVKRLELFGSAASGDFDPVHSDIDFFYEFDNADTSDIADRFFDLKDELEALLGCFDYRERSATFIARCDAALIDQIVSNLLDLLDPVP